MTELKPCPFCGGHNILVGDSFGPLDLFYAVCDGCAGEGPRELTREKAIDSWNRRTEPNEVLTIDKIRSMYSLPVWSEEENTWCLIENKDCGNRIRFPDGSSRSLVEAVSFYGPFYRHKPEGSEG